MATALIIVDVQYDFLYDGSLAVSDGDEVVPLVEGLLDGSWAWSRVIVSQDYHPPGHISFASAHPGQTPFSTLAVTDARGVTYEQTLWPDHCVVGTHGVQVHSDIWKAVREWDGQKEERRAKLVRKGWHKHVEAYSAFEGYLTDPSAPAEPPSTLPATNSVDAELIAYLVEQKVEKVVVVGLATDFCVAQTIYSALRSGKFAHVAVLAPAVRGISAQAASEVFDQVIAMGGEVIGREGNWTPEVAEALGKVVARV